MPLRPLLLAGVVAASGILVLQQSGLNPFASTEDPFEHSAAISSEGADGPAQNQTPSASSPVAAGQVSQIAQIAPAPTATSTPVRAPSGPVVDETALRYFAARGDTKRLEAEIARLRALYPDWTPPENPLAAVPQGDPQLDEMWRLYSEGKIADVRKAIAARQTREPNWQVPADLLDRLAVAESREQLVNASNIKQYDTVIRVASANPAMLTCGDVDVLWRVAEAFALTDRMPRAVDAYLYILRNCENADERLATVQKALDLLPRNELDQLLAAGRIVDGRSEFESVLGEIARRAVIAADADPKTPVSPADLALVEKLADADGARSDDLMLGWYYLQHENPGLAEERFRKAFAKQRDAAAAQGLALALINQDRPQEAEDILYEWRDASDDVRAVYLAAVANMLAIQPPPEFRSEVLQRVVAEVAKAQDAASAQQLGWYADSLNQVDTAERWFRTALGWKPDDEPSAFGLALMRWKLGDQPGVSEVQTAWAGRSERIPTVGERSVETAAIQRRERGRLEIGPALDPSSPRPVHALPETLRPLSPDSPRLPAVEAPAERPRSDLRAPDQTSVEIQETAPREAPIQAAATYLSEEPKVARSQARRQKGNRVGSAGCRTTEDPEGLSPNAALARGWCLMEANRPAEAAKAFEVALRGKGQTRSDAAYGQSLAYMRLGLTDMAAVAATKAPFNNNRSVEINAALLASRANSAYQNGRYVETLLALDERARLVPEPLDLMVLRGYAFLNLVRYGDAERVFRAAARAGNRDAMRGLNDLAAARNPGSSPY